MEHSRDLQVILDFLNIKEPTEADYVDCVTRSFNILQAAAWNFEIKTVDSDFCKWELKSYNRYRPSLEVIYHAHIMTSRTLEIFIATVITHHEGQMSCLPKDDE